MRVTSYLTVDARACVCECVRAAPFLKDHCSNLFGGNVYQITIQYEKNKTPMKASVLNIDTKKEINHTGQYNFLSLPVNKHVAGIVIQ